MFKSFFSLPFHCIFIYHKAFFYRTSQKQVFRSGKVSHIVEFLINYCNTVFCGKLRRHGRKRFAIYNNFSGSRNNRPRTGFNQCRFSGSIFSYQGKDFSFFYAQRNIFKRRNTGVFFFYILQLHYIFIVHILPCALTAEPFTVPPAFYMYALLIISQILSNIIGIDYKQGSKHILFCKTLTGKQFFV